MVFCGMEKAPRHFVIHTCLCLLLPSSSVFPVLGKFSTALHHNKTLPLPCQYYKKLPVPRRRLENGLPPPCLTWPSMPSSLAWQLIERRLKGRKEEQFFSSLFINALSQHGQGLGTEAHLPRIGDRQPFCPSLHQIPVDAHTHIAWHFCTAFMVWEKGRGLP